MRAAVVGRHKKLFYNGVRLSEKQLCILVAIVSWMRLFRRPVRYRSIYKQFPHLDDYDNSVKNSLICKGLIKSERKGRECYVTPTSRATLVLSI